MAAIRNPIRSTKGPYFIRLRTNTAATRRGANTQKKQEAAVEDSNYLDNFPLMQCTTLITK